MAHGSSEPGAIGDRDSSSGTFTTETAGLSEASRPEVERLKDGDRFELRIGPVRKQLDGADLRMLAYNGSIPGPTLHVDQGSEITVDVTNHGDVAATVHWHGLRLENRYDGVPHDTQAPIEIGETFTYKVQFPDAGFYWYHPHIREDFGLEMGLYGTIIVEPTDTAYWPAADRQLTITLDDVLVEDGHIASFDKAGPNFTAMGRFGNVMLINGETSFAGEAAPGEVVRLYLVNTANTRIFNFAIPGARTKLVGSDSGRYEHETFVDEVLLAPSERAVVDVLFDTPGRGSHWSIEHPTTPTTSVRSPSPATGSRVLRHPSRRSAWIRSSRAEHRSIQPDLERPPDKVLAFFSRMPLLYGGGTPNSYACPMHPDVTSLEPGSCPKCGMTLAPVFAPDAPATSYVCPMHPEVTAAEPGTCPECGMKLVPSEAAPEPNTGTHPVTGHGEHGHGDGLEWEDLMPEINRASDSSNMIWQLIDRETGAENGAISWDFTVGDRVKIRLVNEMEQITPCITRSTSTERAGSSSLRGTMSRKRTWCGRTRSSFARGRPWTSCSM